MYVYLYIEIYISTYYALILKHMYIGRSEFHYK
jgi:hypothetical protein